MYTKFSNFKYLSLKNVLYVRKIVHDISESQIYFYIVYENNKELKINFYYKKHLDNEYKIGVNDYETVFKSLEKKQKQTIKILQNKNENYEK
jgi:hypothetical protein